VAVPWLALVDDPAGGNLQRGKQRRGPVPDVVVGALLGSARGYAADWAAGLEGLDLGFLVHAQHHSAFGRV
jgi:hypothetical protein